jgi:ABC-type multidrug transport system fused ATPase/permease subunit
MKANIKETLKLYWQYSKRYKLAGVTLILACVIQSVAITIIPLYYKKFFDIFGLSLSQSAVVHSLLQILVMVAIFGLLEKTMFFVMNKALSKFEIDTMVDLANVCFDKLHRHSFTYFNNNFSGALVKRVNYFIRSFEAIVDSLFFQILPTFITVTMVVTVLLLRNQWLGLIVLIWLVVFIILNAFAIKYRIKYDLERNEAESAMTADLSDTIVNHSNLRLFNGFRAEVKRFRDLNETIKKYRLQAWGFHTNFDTVQSFLGLVLNISLMYVGVRLWQVGKFSIGDFVLLQSYVMLVVNNIRWLGNITRKTYQNLSDASEMTEILNLPLEIVDASHAKKLAIARGEINFEQADFYFNETRQVLKKFTLDIKGGERLALIGPSGVGKTTIINLLLRNYELGGGKILIDGQSISQVTLDSLRAAISLVPQDPILFHRSLMENISYGKEHATKEEIIKASKQAYCHEFITDLENGYDTLVGERGVKLSGGERQRVAIARAILRGAPILILDEATSSLDSASEALIQEALEKLMKNKTVIVIAHRLSTIRKMDRIVYVDETGIAETGTHDELVDRPNGLYRKLWERQSAGFLAS